MSKELTITKKAVLVAGGGLKVAEALGVHYESIRRWQNTDTFDPAHVKKLCELGGDAFKPHQIRPDIFEVQ